MFSSSRPKSTIEVGKGAISFEEYTKVSGLYQQIKMLKLELEAAKRMRKANPKAYFAEGKSPEELVRTLNRDRFLPTYRRLVKKWGRSSSATHEKILGAVGENLPPWQRSSETFLNWSPKVK